jgi:CRP/FNR family transcriptional regulator, cyclic AMP receptor protein
VVIVPWPVGWQDLAVEVERLEGVGLFSMLTKAELKKLSRWIDEVDVGPGRELTREGAIAHEFFVIEDGAASVRQDGEEISTLGPGDFFGEIALLESPRRTATVVAITPMQLLVMHSRDFKAMEHEMPLVADRLRAAIYARLN